jgi:hypothetical protein
MTRIGIDYPCSLSFSVNLGSRRIPQAAVTPHTSSTAQRTARPPAHRLRMGWGQGVHRMLSNEAQHPASAGRA